VHSNNIIHRDIKPQNIVFDATGKAIIADFGLAEILPANSDFITKGAGSYHFMSPESLAKESKGFSGKAADLWALGITLFAFVYYKLPFYINTSNPIDLFELIEKKL
jgi:[calcium/calmodulin-dependent protein kinase] kinase